MRLYSLCNNLFDDKSLTRHKKKTGVQLLQAHNSLSSESAGEQDKHGAGNNGGSHLGSVSDRGGALLLHNIISRVILANGTNSGGGGLIFQCDFL